MAQHNDKSRHHPHVQLYVQSQMDFICSNFIDSSAITEDFFLIELKRSPNYVATIKNSETIAGAVCFRVSFLFWGRVSLALEAGIQFAV